MSNVKPPSTAEKKARGRPRSERIQRAVLRAARELLAEGGPGAVTMEAVAARARVGKPTVYRWWPDRHAVVMTALMDAESEATAPRTARSALSALRQQLDAISQRFSTPTGRHVASLIAASDPDSELSRAFRNHFVLARRTEGKALLQRAMTEGQVRLDANVEVALDLLYGPVFFRLMMGHAPLDGAFIEAVLDHALQGLKAGVRTRRAPR